MGVNGGERRESHTGKPHPHLLIKGKSDLICRNIVLSGHHLYQHWICIHQLILHLLVIRRLLFPPLDISNVLAL